MNPYALLDPAVAVVYHLLVALAGVLPFPHAGVRLAVALALVTVGARLLLLPLSLRLVKAQQARAALAPQLAALRRRFGRDRRRLALEIQRVHREAGVPLSGGLGAGLLQLPVIATVYRLVVVPTVAGAPNLLLTTSLFGAPMAAHWPEVLSVAGVLGAGTVAFVALLLALLALAVVSSRDAARLAAAAPPVPPEDDNAAAAAALTQWLVRVLPYGTVLVATISPVTLGIYLLVSTSWAVAERRILPRLAGPGAGSGPASALAG